MRKTIITVLLPMVLCFSLLGCSKDAEIPDTAFLGDVEAVSREEGSGTREEFENIVGTSGIGTDIIASSTNEVTELVAAESNRIGYMAYSAVDESAGVKSIAVNGIEADTGSIQDGSYPLIRYYYIAYSGQLTAAENDFVSYIMSAGQGVVEEYSIPVKESGTFLSDKSAGIVNVSGSSSMADIMEALAADYNKYNPNVTVNINVTDSTQGLTAAMRGECGIAMSSRELKDYEEELLTKKAIAKDAIAVIVNDENPVDNLSVKQIKRLYDKEAESWSDLG